MALDKSGVPNVYAYRGRHLLSQYHAQHKHIPNHKLSDLKGALHNHDPTPSLPVCIIGAGAAGLYTAMIFECLGIDYQIVDADTEDRVGGRLFTYYFPNGGSYDYYEVGAMRFPNTSFMKRLYDLATNRSLSVKLIPYVMQMIEPANTFLFYNNARTNNQDSERVASVLQTFRDLFTVQPLDIATAMDRLFERTNRYSMRSYMLETQEMSARDISWCETLDKSTGWYDRALTETVIESLAFDWPTASTQDPELPNSDTNTPWHCFDGGSSTLPKAMFNSLSQTAQEAAQFESPVTAISEDSDNNYMKISINVLSHIPPLMDLNGVGINSNYAQWSAIRELQYGPAIKVGLKSSSAWWETELPKPIRGGQSYTDLPLRTIVYPSYPKDTTQDEMSKVLIVSYCRTQDTERLGALINSDGTAQPELIDLVFRNLAAVHNVDIEWLQGFYTPGDCFAWDWLHDPLTMGGYAFFGPGVYEAGDVYSEILQPAATGKLFFAGEATSACHARVAGALDSAWRAVDQYLALNHTEEVQQRFWDAWGPTGYWDEASNSELVDLNRKLTERHLVIALHKSGVRIPT